jgi:hypothetical protein
MLKNEIMYILWETNMHDYGNLRYLIPMMGEQAKYDIVSLELISKDKEKFLCMIDNIIGEYHDFFPCLKIKDDLDY